METGIEVRVTSLGDNDAHVSAALIAAAFHRLAALMRKIRASAIPEHLPPTTDPNELLNRRADDIEAVGLASLLAVMLKSYHPRLACDDRLTPRSAPDNGRAAHNVYSVVRIWVGELAALAPEDDTDEVWTLFSKAVSAARLKQFGLTGTESETARLVAELVRLAPRSDAPVSWESRVSVYADRIMPEYTRWFAHLVDPEDVELPRI
jgi:hypothetical protein